jgi:hypothetical protein
VLPSRVEALPLVLVEAVSAGLPAVATDVGDVREALADVVELVPPEDPRALGEALRRLLADPADRERRGRAGITAARERLTAQRMAQQAWAAFLPAALPSPASRSASASTLSGLIRRAQRWSIGQTRCGHGLQPTSWRTTACRAGGCRHRAGRPTGTR